MEDFLANNHVHFVTFNYDRTIENFFYFKLLHTYNLTPEKALEALQRIEIKHVYGSLGLRSNKRNKTDFVNADYKQAAEGIQLMFDVRQQETDAMLASCTYSSLQANVFLGFAFDDKTSRLKLNRVQSKTKLYATDSG